MKRNMFSNSNSISDRTDSNNTRYGTTDRACVGCGEVFFDLDRRDYDFCNECVNDP